MSKSGIGNGSASIVLVFAVLCLSVFSLIAFTVAGNDKALAENEANLAGSYYEADALAERVLAEVIASEVIPENAFGVDIELSADNETGTDTVSFVCPLSDEKELYVSAALNGDSYEILSWRMRDIGDWEFDDSLGVIIIPE